MQKKKKIGLIKIKIGSSLVCLSVWQVVQYHGKLYEDKF